MIANIFDNRNYVSITRLKDKQEETMTQDSILKIANSFSKIEDLLANHMLAYNNTVSKLFKPIKWIHN